MEVLMGSRSEEYRVEASRLERQAEVATDNNARLVLRKAAQQLREIADEIEPCEVTSRSAA
jgi:hypothetical protein